MIRERWFVLVCWRRMVWMALRIRLARLDQLVRTIDDRSSRSRRSHPIGSADALRLLRAAARRARPRPACLVTALVGYELLRERGVPAVLVLGARTPDRRFQAHAWLEQGTTVVVGAPADDYTRVWQWPAA